MSKFITNGLTSHLLIFKSLLKSHLMIQIAISLITIAIKLKFIQTWLKILQKFNKFLIYFPILYFEFHFLK